MPSDLYRASDIRHRVGFDVELELQRLLEALDEGRPEMVDQVLVELLRAAYAAGERGHLTSGRGGVLL